MTKNRANQWSRYIVGLAIVLQATFMSSAARAQAEEFAAAVEVVDYIQKAYEAYKTLSEIFGDKGPSLAQQLNQVKVAIINELRTQRNQQWSVNAQDVFDDFAILGYGRKADPSNVRLRENAILLARHTISNYAIIVEDLAAGKTDDFTSAYHLSPVFNALLTTYIGLAKMKGELTPDFPTTWGEYNLILQRGMRVNYTLVGSQKNGCYSDDPYYWHDATLISTTTKDFTKSQFWVKSIGNKSVTIKNAGLFASMDPAALAVALRHYQSCPVSTLDPQSSCNPVSRRCSTYASPHVNSYASCSGYLYITTPELLGAAENALRKDFDKNSMVKVVRAGMNGLLSVAGGRTGREDSNTLLPFFGVYVDPSIGKCRNGFGNYPVTP